MRIDDLIRYKFVLFGGRFQPFHLGHYQVYQHLCQKFGKQNTFIITSNNVDNERSFFDFNQRKLIINRMFDIPKSRIRYSKNPYSPAEFISNFNPEQIQVIYALGNKDAERLAGKYFHPIEKDAPFMPYTQGAYVYPVPDITCDVSATKIRNAWRLAKTQKQKEEVFKTFYGHCDPAVFELFERVFPR